MKRSLFAAAKMDPIFDTKEEIMADKRYCPHCGEEMEYWEAPPDTGWGYIYVCFNNRCEFYRGSAEEIMNKSEDQSRMGCRYGEDPLTNYTPINVLAYCPF